MGRIRYTREDVERVLALRAEGRTISEIALLTNVERGTVGAWTKSPDRALSLPRPSSIPEPVSPTEQRRRDNIVEDVTWMLRTAETHVDNIARRLMPRWSPQHLVDALVQWGRADLVDRMTGTEYLWRAA